MTAIGVEESMQLAWNIVRYTEGETLTAGAAAGRVTAIAAILRGLAPVGEEGEALAREAAQKQVDGCAVELPERLVFYSRASWLSRKDEFWWQVADSGFDEVVSSYQSNQEDIRGVVEVLVLRRADRGLIER